MNIDLNSIRKKFENHKPRPIGKHNFFSVLVPFIEKDGKTYLLFEVRGSKVSQPGEICFPGGHMEEGETSLECALRETKEEIGIEKGIEIIGQGNTLNGYANYTLFTHLASVTYESLENLKLEDGEVAEVFILDLEEFILNPPQIFTENIYTEINEAFPYEKLGIDRNYPWRKGSWEIPIYTIENRIVWGLTARIIKDIIESMRK